MSKQALSGLKVLDLTHHIAGPLCSRLLADLGAEVIKIEKPGDGDTARRVGPFFGDDPDPEKSIPFLYFNFNKQGVTLNLKTAGGKDIFKQLILWADILVENFAPRVLPGLGLDYETLAKINPALIMTSISNFGQTGPYRDYKAADIVEYALGGMLYISGAYDREPVKHGLSQAQIIAGHNASVGTLTALYCQRQTGSGQHVDVSIAESVAAMQVPHPVSYAWHGGIMRRQMRTWSIMNRIAPCKNGYVSPLLIAGYRPWDDLAAFLESPELAAEKFQNPAGRVIYGNELYELLATALADRTKEEIFHSAQTWRFPWTLVQDPEDLTKCPQLAARDYYVEIDHPRTGKVAYPGALAKLSQTPWQAKLPAPLLGQHNAAVYCDTLGYSKQDLVKLREQGVI
jgi:CoA:oxalate CoA-transferase